MAEQTGGQAFTSLEMALAEGDFAAVDIMLPHHMHEEAAVRSFAAGKHVVLEKPIAPTPDSCARARLWGRGKNFASRAPRAN